jgi:hypothetical protein
MIVSELKPGMLLRPKEGCTFRLYRAVSWSVGTVAPAYMQLECHRRASPDKILGTSPVVYLGVLAKSAPDNTSAYQYESRRAIFSTATGSKLRVAPEAWRNMEAVTS